HSYLVASLEFAYTAVELVEAQLERSLRAAQDGLAAALTEGEILEMERLLVAEQKKMDDMKANCRMRTQRIVESKHRKSVYYCRMLMSMWLIRCVPEPFMSPSKTPATGEKAKPRRRMSLSLLG
ncbi:hypothetical protein C0993_003120, partial [Termitomyces sp. T159_Od127]